MGRLSLKKRISATLQFFRGTAVEDWNAYFGTPSMRQLTKAGTRVNETNALSISAIFAALNFLAGVMASLPLRIYRSLPDGGKEKAVNHPLFDRLYAKPNEFMTAWQWKYTTLIHKYLWGNEWTWRDPRSGELIILLPDRTRLDETERFVLTHDAEARPLPPIDRRDVLLIPHVSLAGVVGKGIIHYARESLGLMKAQEEFASTFFGNGIKAGGFVETEQPMNEETRKGLQADFNNVYGQMGEAYKAIFLAGAKWKPNEIDAQKAQALESRQFSISEVSRWTGLTPHLLHDLSHATFSNIEELDLALKVFTVMPIATQKEQAINALWLTDQERTNGYYSKYDLKGLERGNLAARTAFYTAMLDRGVFSADQILELEDMNPQPAGLGKVYVLPYNMASKEQVLKGEEPAAELDAGEEVEEQEEEENADERSRKRSTQRRLLTKAWKPSFGRALQQLMKQEIKAIREAVKDCGPADFGLWLEEFYRDFPDEAQKTIGRSVGDYSASLLPVALDEIGSKADVSIPYDIFRQHYLDDLVRRYIEASQRSLSAVLKNVNESGMDLTGAVEDQLREWEQKRAARVILYETVRAEGAFSHAAFEAAGVQRLRWISHDKDSPYCENLDGKIVGIGDAFVGAGDYQPEGADAPLKISGARKHPPLYGGCNCAIEASK